MINKKAIAQSVLLLAAVLMIGFGIWRGEADTVLAKAREIPTVLSIAGLIIVLIALAMLVLSDKKQEVVEE